MQALECKEQGGEFFKVTEKRIAEICDLYTEFEHKRQIAEAAGLASKAADIAADGVGRKALEALPELVARIKELERLCVLQEHRLNFKSAIIEQYEKKRA